MLFEQARSQCLFQLFHMPSNVPFPLQLSPLPPSAIPPVTELPEGCNELPCLLPLQIQDGPDP